MAYPKIVWNDGAAHTLAFSYPPVEKQGADARRAVRHDTDSSSGIRQSVTERIDHLRTVTMNFVPAADVQAWSDFLDFALTGAPFSYYPDADVSSSTDYTLEDTDWDPKFNFRGMFKFTLLLRQLVTA